MDNFEREFYETCDEKTLDFNIHLSIQHQLTEEINFFLGSNNNNIRKYIEKNITTLCHNAAFNSGIEILALLLEKNEEINNFRKKVISFDDCDNIYKRMIYSAIQGNKKDIIFFLLNHVKDNHKKDYYISALSYTTHMIIEADKLDFFEALINNDNFSIKEELDMNNCMVGIVRSCATEIFDYCMHKKIINIPLMLESNKENFFNIISFDLNQNKGLLLGKIMSIYDFDIINQLVDKFKKDTIFKKLIKDKKLKSYISDITVKENNQTKLKL